MDLFGRASWVVFAVGALPTGLAGWWIGGRAGTASTHLLAVVALSAVAASFAVSFLAWRWLAAPLRELERGLERWTQGDLSTPLDESHMGGWRRLARQFSLTQADLHRSLEEAKAELAIERVRLQTLVEKLPDALIITNLRGDVAFFSAAAMAIIGVGPRDVQPGGRALFAPVKPERWRMEVQALLRRHSAGKPVEIAVPNGSALIYSTTVTMFGGASFGDFGVLLMLRDVTAERRLDALKEEFFQSAAHDLRAPLFAIQGYLRLLRKSLVLDQKQTSWFDAVEQSGEKLTLLVKDALDEARIENGHLKIAPTTVDLHALLRRTAQLFVPLADERGIALEDAPDESTPASFLADERLIERLLHNLVANAIKFTPQGGHVRVAASGGPDCIELTVSDTGPGIPENLRSVIFEKFRQLESAGCRSGFGLGLSICAKIVKLHGGLIWVEPGAGGGSRFIARLPLSQTPKETS
ncbi:MAG: ATP-binding protein [Elusimicrobiota bacterium]